MIQIFVYLYAGLMYENMMQACKHNFLKGSYTVGGFLAGYLSIHIPCLNLDVASMGTRTSASLGGNCIVHNIAGAELCTITPLVPVQLAVS